MSTCSVVFSPGASHLARTITISYVEDCYGGKEFPLSSRQKWVKPKLEQVVLICSSSTAVCRLPGTDMTRLTLVGSNSTKEMSNSLKHPVHALRNFFWCGGISVRGFFDFWKGGEISEYWTCFATMLKCGSMSSGPNFCQVCRRYKNMALRLHLSVKILYSVLKFVWRDTYFCAITFAWQPIGIEISPASTCENQQTKSYYGYAFFENSPFKIRNEGVPHLLYLLMHLAFMLF